MLHALLRKARADIADRPLQVALVFLAVAAATAVLATAATTSVSAGNAYMSIFKESNGAHVWFSFFSPPGQSARSDLTRIGELDSVTATSGPHPESSRTFPTVLGDGSVDLLLYGLGPELPEVGRPIVTKGRWLSADGEGEIVLDRGLSRHRDVDVGDRIELLKPDGAETFEVVGLAVTAARSSYSWGDTEALAFVLPSTLEEMEPDRDYWHWTYGVRIAEPEEVGRFVRSAIGLYPEGAELHWQTWESLRDEAHEGVRILSLLIGVFGVFAIVAAALVIVNVIGGYVLAQVRDIGLLKSVGWTPRQVAALLLLEHVGLSIPAALLGTAIGFLGAPLVLRAAEDPPPAVFDPIRMLVIAFGVPLAIAAMTLIPARRGGQVSVVQAITAGLFRAQSRASRAARLATWLRLPTTMALGFKDAFNRPVRSAMTVTALAGAVVLSTFALGLEAALRDIIEDPSIVGGPKYELSVFRGHGMPAVEVSALLDGRPEVKSYYQGREFFVAVSGAGSQLPIRLGAVGDGYDRLAPYISEGRLFSGPGEAIITRNVLEATGADIGDVITVVLTRGPITVYESNNVLTVKGIAGGDPFVDGKELQLRVVGILYGFGRWEARTGLDTLRQQVDPDIEPEYHRVKVKADVDPEALKLALLRETGDRLAYEVDDVSEEAREIASFLMPPIYTFTGALLAIGAVNLLITLLFTVRERYRDFGILKTLGLTPRQIAAGVATNAGLMAIIALVVGTPLGFLLTRLLFNLVGAEFGTIPGPLWIAVLVPVTFLVAVLGSALPARRAGATNVVEGLRYE